jgi:uncharacterized protein YcfL
MSARLVLILIVVLLAGCRDDTIEDRKRGQSVVCHDGTKTLAVSNADSFVHMGHGDTAGPCADNSP